MDRSTRVARQGVDGSGKREASRLKAGGDGTKGKKSNGVPHKKAYPERESDDQPEDSQWNIIERRIKSGVHLTRQGAP